MHSLEWLDVLSQRQAMSRDAALRHASDLLGYQLIADDAFDALMPDFETVAYAQMVARVVFIARDEGGMRQAVVGQPLSPALGAWLATLDVADVRMADPQLLLARLE